MFIIAVLVPTAPVVVVVVNDNLCSWSQNKIQTWFREPEVVEDHRSALSAQPQKTFSAIGIDGERG